MMRLTTPGNLRLQQSRELSVNYGGSEANVAISVANFGGQVDYVTRLPENPLGEACIAELRSHNIGTDHILTGGKRLGTYYMEKAAAMRNSRVIYDREGSSFSELEPGMINWKEIFSDAGLFHWSGIDAALTPGLAEVCREAVETAREMGISVSYDINYRKNLLEVRQDSPGSTPPADCLQRHHVRQRRRICHALRTQGSGIQGHKRSRPV